MDAVIKKLQEERLSLWEQQKAALDQAAGEGRTHLDGQDEQAYNERNTRIDEIDGRVKELLDTRKRSEEAERAFDELLAKPQQQAAGRAAGDDGPQDEEAQLRAFLLGQTGQRAFDVKPAKRSGGWRRSAAEARDLAVGTATAGGNTVPISFYNQLQAHLIEVSGLLMAGPTVLNTDSGEQLQIPKTTAHSSAAIVAEAGAIPEDDPTFGQARLDAYKYGLLLDLSRELVEDTGVDLLGYLAMQAGRALGNGFGEHGIVGTGTDQPQGVVPAATAGVTGTNAVAGVFTAENLIDLHFSVIAPYRNSPSCAWLMQDSTLGAVRKLRDGSGGTDDSGQFLWQPSLVVGAPDTLLGKPVHTDPFVPAVAADARSVLFGDFRQYFVRMVNGIRFERSDEYRFGNDQITYRALLRADGELVDRTGAVKAFVGGPAV